MIFRSGIKIAEWVGAILGGLALVIAVGFWLLSRGPVSLDWLAPYVAANFAAAEPGLLASVDHTFIRLRHGPRLEIIARGIHLRRADGKAELTLPVVTLSLSARAAFSGQVAPTRILLDRPKLSLLRAADGSFHIGIAGEQPGTGDWAEALLRDLAQPPGHENGLDYLRHIELRDASLIVRDRKLGATWEAKRLDATLSRQANGLSGDFALAIERGRRSTQLNGEVGYDMAQHRLHVALSFDDLRPTTFAAAAPALKPLAALDLPLGGRVSLTLDTEHNRLTDFWCDLELGKGRVVDPKLAGGALTIVTGRLRAVYDPAKTQLNLEHFAVTLDEPTGPKLDLVATIDHFDPFAKTPLDFAGHLRVHDLRVPDFPRLWPADVAFHARTWILKHVLKGELTSSDIALTGRIVPDAPGGITAHIKNVDGRFSYRDVSVAYFPPLAPVTHLDGTARFDRKHMDLKPSGGIARDVKVPSGTIHLTQLDTDHEQAYVDARLEGPLATVLDELNKKPLRYASALGIDPAHVKGRVDGEVHFHLPMKKDLKFAWVDYSARAKLNRVAIGRIFFNRDLTAGKLSLAVTRGALSVAGSAQLERIPVMLDWTEKFGGGTIRTAYHLRGRFDDAQRQKLGIDWLSHIVSGPIGVDLTFSRNGTGTAISDIKLDLADAAIVVKQLGWRKRPGTPETARFTIAAQNGLPTQISDIRIAGGGLDATGDIVLTSGAVNAQIARLDVRHLAVGHTDLAGMITRRPEGGWAVRLHGKSLNAAPLLDDLQTSKPAGAPQRGPPLVITADIGRVYLAPDRFAAAVHAQLYSDGWHWQNLRLAAAPAPGAKLRLRFGGVAGDRKLRLVTDDFGALLRLLNVSSKVHGGHLTVTGTAEDKGWHRVLRGHFTGADYTVVDAPVFARLLSLASLTGPAALLSGQGIPFIRVQGDYTLADGKIELKNARAFGEAIGINASGLVDYRDNTVDLRGTVVPAYLLNSLLGNIPVLGDILLGGKGQGIFAANFRVAGPADDPGVSVNPLSAFAPGFLRHLFLFDAGMPETDSAKGKARSSGG